MATEGVIGIPVVILYMYSFYLDTPESSVVVIS